MGLKLKTLIDNPVEVIGPLRDYYAKRDDGKYVLALDGDPAGYVRKETHAEFRENNRNLNAAKTELEARLKAFDGLDPTTARAALDKLATFEEEYRALKARPDQTSRVTELEGQLALERAAKATAQKTADDAIFITRIGDAFLRAGGQPDAQEFMVTKARDKFTVVDGALTTKEFSQAKPGEPLTVDEWMGTQIHTSAFAFKPSSGGGAGGHRGAPPTKRTIGNDPVEFGKNLAAIAKGEITVS